MTGMVSGRDSSHGTLIAMSASATTPLPTIPETHAALRAARRCGRQDGAVRRLRDARAVSARHAEGAPADARQGGAVRRLAHGAGFWSSADGKADNARPRWKRWFPPISMSLRPGQPALLAASQRRRRHHRRPDGVALAATPKDDGRLFWWSTPRARTSTTRTSPRDCRQACTLHAGCRTRALLALQGPAAAARPGSASVPRSRA